MFISDCSRYWKCDIDENGDICDLCLLECPSCPGGPTDPNCDGQEALTFDPSYQYPQDPVCGWPVDTECPVLCDTSLPEYQCCSWYDCPSY